MSDLTAITPNVGDSALKVLIRPQDIDCWEYEGSRAQLEAEGVIPPGTKWPEGIQDRQWEVGGLRYWLRRCRPDGMKGPMKLWTTGDWWRLRCSLSNGPDPANARILRKRAELAAELYRHSAAGQRELAAKWKLHMNARYDPTFQTFLASLVPARKKPVRKRTSP